MLQPAHQVAMMSWPLFCLARNSLEGYFIIVTFIWVRLCGFYCHNLQRMSWHHLAGGCGHIILSFNMHVCCARYHDRGAGSDACVLGQDD